MTWVRSSKMISCLSNTFAFRAVTNQSSSQLSSDLHTWNILIYIPCPHRNKSTQNKPPKKYTYSLLFTWTWSTTRINFGATAISVQDKAQRTEVELCRMIISQQSDTLRIFVYGESSAASAGFMGLSSDADDRTVHHLSTIWLFPWAVERGVTVFTRVGSLLPGHIDSLTHNRTNSKCIGRTFLFSHGESEMRTRGEHERGNEKPLARCLLAESSVRIAEVLIVLVKCSPAGTKRLIKCIMCYFC